MSEMELVINIVIELIFFSVSVNTKVMCRRERGPQSGTPPRGRPRDPDQREGLQGADRGGGQARV